jgi:Asp-tRNA(Asn)/Glu-tRNA(Gln) amidotransferase C subunit
MTALDSSVARLPEHAERIRRLFWRDAEFRGLCTDLHVAAETLTRLRHDVPREPERVAEYQQMLTEMLDELLDSLRQDRNEEVRRS